MLIIKLNGKGNFTQLMLGQHMKANAFGFKVYFSYHDQPTMTVPAVEYVLSLYTSYW